MASPTPFQGLCLLFNFFVAILVIFINKSIFTTFSLPYPGFLTLSHYLFTTLVLRGAGWLGLFQVKECPYTWSFVFLALVVATAAPLHNLSLQLNSTGFYQLAKILATPSIVWTERMFYEKRLSTTRQLLLVLICAGVAVATVTDVKVNFWGTFAVLVNLPLVVFYKIGLERFQKDTGCTSLQAMHQLFPIALFWQCLIAPCIDPSGFWDTQGEPLRNSGAFLAVLVSCVGAFAVNWSGTLVLGACSALSHVLLGQLKTCLILILGFFVYGESVLPKTLFGAIVAVVSLVLYTSLNIREANSKLSKSETMHGKEE